VREVSPVKIVCTGAAGFLGSVLCQRALERGHWVVALDDLSRGLNPVADAAGGQRAPRQRLAFVKHDCQGGFTEALPTGAFIASQWGLDAAGVDAVVHFAAGTGSLDRPYEELRALNVEMTKRVYQDAAALGAKAFVYPTTSLALEVPDSPYVRSKEEAFEWLRGAQHPYETAPRLLAVRLFNVVGAYRGFTERRRREVHLIPRLVECRKTGEPFVVNGQDWETEDGTPSRDFTNVLDVVDFILTNLEYIVLGGAPHPSAVIQPDGALWVGTGWATTARQAADIFAQWAGAVAVKVGPRRAFDCAALRCALDAPGAVRAVIGRPLAPAWVGIRDEVAALMEGA
jgi:UDP-glucose 4-epimerase